MDKSYDLAKLEELSGGSNDFISEIITVFLSDIPEQLTSLNLAYKEKNLDDLARMAHKIKPSIDLLGISLITEDIRKIEEMAKNNNSSVKNCIDNVNKVMKEVINQLQIRFTNNK